MPEGAEAAVEAALQELELACAAMRCALELLQECRDGALPRCLGSIIVGQIARAEAALALLRRQGADRWGYVYRCRCYSCGS